MNCQPSFATGSVPLVGPALDDLGWVGPAVQGGILAEAGPGGQKPDRRVPDCDIVDIGARPRAAWRDEPVDVLDLAVGKAQAAAVRLPEQRAKTTRTYTKALLAFLIFQITAAGGFYLKKRYVETQVIVIPATVNERAVIT
jgi:hypothetical protein